MDPRFLLSVWKWTQDFHISFGRTPQFDGCNRVPLYLGPPLSPAKRYARSFPTLMLVGWCSPSVIYPRARPEVEQANLLDRLLVPDRVGAACNPNILVCFEWS